MRKFLRNSQRIVVKVGTSILTSSQGRISFENLSRLGEDVLGLRALGKEIALVSSGAIAYGMEIYGLKKRPKALATLQACAAIGQSKLMHAYEKLFLPQKVITAQILLTRDGIEHRDRFLTARKAFEELFKMKALPVVNENDTIATDEIKFGDNDILSVHIAHLIHADLLVIMSDVDGFYMKDGTRRAYVGSEQEIDCDLVNHLSDSRKERTVGGMRAKLEAARLAMRLGVSLMILNGHEKNILQRVIAGEDVGTLFAAAQKPKRARKEWIAFSAPQKGTIYLDAGAVEALCHKKRSLLATGIRGVHGAFEKGDVVNLSTLEGEVVGRGLVRFASVDLEKIQGKKTADIRELLGEAVSCEVIHRNDLLLW